MTRRFLPDALPDGVIDELLDLARRAPSAGFSQGVHFLVLQGDDLDMFWDVTGAREWFATTSPSVLSAPVVVVPVADPVAYTVRYSQPDKAGHGLDDAENWPVPFWLTDAAMAAQNLLLLIEERRLGALLFGIFRGDSELLARTGAPDGAKAVGAIAIGYRAADDVVSGSSTHRPRRTVTEVIHHGRW